MSSSPCSVAERTVESGASAQNVVLLTTYMSPHQLAVYRELNSHVRKLTVLLSTPMSSVRSWDIDWGGLDVRVQRCWTIRAKQRHPLQFAEDERIRIPWDTLSHLRSLRADVIVSDELGLRSAFSAIHRRTRSKTRLVLNACLSEHTEKGRGFVRSTLRKWLFSAADQVTYNGSSCRRYLQAMGVPDFKLSHFPYIVSPDVLYYGPLQRDQCDAIRLLYVGQLTPRKGIVPFTHALVHWAKEHPRQKVEFTIVGKGELTSDVAAIAMPSNLQLHLVGTKPLKELPAIYASHDIFAFPTLCDEWGFVVNEALQAGLPILGSIYSQGVADLVRNGANGWAYDPLVPTETEAALNSALSLPRAELESMREATRQSIADYTPEFAAQCLLNAIERAWESPPEVNRK